MTQNATVTSLHDLDVLRKRLVHAARSRLTAPPPSARMRYHFRIHMHKEQPHG